jgi:hypothetical protein
MISEARRAGASFALSDATGAVVRSGDAEAVVGDDALSIGPLTVSFLDADALRAADYRLEIDLWPAGRLALTQLGRRFDTFAEELRRCRNLARVSGVLAHGITMPVVFPGALLSRDGRHDAADFHVFDTHVTIVPRDDDPWQLPVGALRSVAVQDEPPAVVLATVDGSTTFSQLGRQRDACDAAIVERREAQRRLLVELTGLQCFSDGWGATKSDVAGFDRFVERFAAAERLPCARAILAATTAAPRIGFVQLLDPDRDRLQSAAGVPEQWAVFLLAPVGSLTVLEILAGPPAATYLFRGAIESVNRDLQLLHFRRGPLALTSEQAELTTDNPYRLALRRLEPLQRLRSTTAARLVHHDGWENALRDALAAR